MPSPIPTVCPDCGRPLAAEVPIIALAAMPMPYPIITTSIRWCPACDKIIYMEGLEPN